MPPTAPVTQGAPGESRLVGLRGQASPLHWEPPEGPQDNKDVWTRVIFEMTADYPEADMIVTKEDPGSASTSVNAIHEVSRCARTSARFAFGI